MSDILIHTESGVRTITLSRHDKKNALTSSMYGELAQALRDAELSPDVRVLVLQGSEMLLFCRIVYCSLFVRAMTFTTLRKTRLIVRTLRCSNLLRP